MKKQYIKPEMQSYDIKMTQILCGSDGYDEPLGYAPGQNRLPSHAINNAPA
jgi:hypothetical protein